MLSSRRLRVFIYNTSENQPDDPTLRDVMRGLHPQTPPLHALQPPAAALAAAALEQQQLQQQTQQAPPTVSSLVHEPPPSWSLHIKGVSPERQVLCSQLFLPATLCTPREGPARASCMRRQLDLRACVQGAGQAVGGTGNSLSFFFQRILVFWGQDQCVVWDGVGGGPADELVIRRAGVQPDSVRILFFVKHHVQTFAVGSRSAP